MGELVMNIVAWLMAVCDLPHLWRWLGGQRQPVRSHRRGCWLIDIKHGAGVVRVALGRRRAGPWALARPWLIAGATIVYAPDQVFRLATSERVREVYTFHVPPGATDLMLHISPGGGEPGIDLFLPQPSSRPARPAA